MKTTRILVRKTGGDNVTNTVKGVRTSSTSSPLDAAQKQARKLYGDALQGVRCIEESTSSAVYEATYLQPEQPKP